MSELVDQILSLPQDERLTIAMKILLSIRMENEQAPDWHHAELDKFQQKLAGDQVHYLSEAEFWTEARKRVS